MGVAQVASRLVRPAPLGVVQQDAGDDLQAVGDAVAHLLQQHEVVPKGVVLRLEVGAGLRHVGDGYQQPLVLHVEIDQPLGVDDQAAVGLPRPFEVHLVGFDLGRARQGRVQQRLQLRHMPFPCAQAGQRPAGGACRVDLEGAGKGFAGGDDVEIAVKQQEGARGRRHDRHGQA